MYSWESKNSFLKWDKVKDSFLNSGFKHIWLILKKNYIKMRKLLFFYRSHILIMK